MCDFLLHNNVKYRVLGGNSYSMLTLFSANYWSGTQAKFENKLLSQLYFHLHNAKLAERLKVYHNKIAMKLRMHAIK